MLRCSCLDGNGLLLPVLYSLVPHTTLIIPRASSLCRDAHPPEAAPALSSGNHTEYVLPGPTAPCQSTSAERVVVGGSQRGNERSNVIFSGLCSSPLPSSPCTSVDGIYGQVAQYGEPPACGLGALFRQTGHSDRDAGEVVRIRRGVIVEVFVIGGLLQPKAVPWQQCMSAVRVRLEVRHLVPRSRREVESRNMRRLARRAPDIACGLWLLAQCDAGSGERPVVPCPFAARGG